MDTNKKSEKMPAGCIFLCIIGIICLMMIIWIGVLKGRTKKNIEKSPKIEMTLEKWNLYSYEQKQLWIENYIKKPDDKGYSLIGYTNEVIKKQFSYPSTVNLKWGGANFVEAWVVDADSGWVNKYVEASAKNAYNLELKHKVLVRWKITPFIVDLRSIEISEPY